MKPWWTYDKKTPSTLMTVWLGINDVNVSEWRTEQLNLLTKVCVGYLLRIYSFHDMTVIGKQLPLNITQWRQLRHLLLKVFRTVLVINLMIIRGMAADCKEKQLQLVREVHYGELYYGDMAIYDNLTNMQLASLCQLRLYDLPKDNIPNCEQVRSVCGEFFSDTTLTDWIGRFANRKLKFLMSSQNLEFFDIVGDLIKRYRDVLFPDSIFSSRAST